MKRTRMRPTRLIKILMGIGAVLLLLFLVNQSQSLDFEEYGQYHRILVRFKEKDATLNQGILRARYEIVTSYDPLVNDIEAQKQIQVALQQLPKFIDQSSQQQIQSLLAEHATVLQQKEEVLEYFKSKNAVLKNSLRYLPTLTLELVENTTLQAKSIEPVATLEALLQDILLYNLTADEALAPQITTQLAQFEEQYDDLENGALMALAVTHMKSVLNHKPQVDALTQQLLQLSTRFRFEQLEAIYENQYQRAIAAASFYRFCAYLNSLMLLGWLAYLAINNLTQANRKNANILQSITDAFIAINHKWQINYLNSQAAQVLQSQTEQLLGQDFWQVLPATVGINFYQAYEQAMNQEVLATFETYYSPFKAWFEIRACPSADGLSVFLRDITEHKQNQEALQQLNQQLETKTTELSSVNEQLQQEIYERASAQTELQQSERQLRTQAQQLETALHELQQAQAQLVQHEKMSSLGQLVAGVAHEINNPVNFIHGNITHAQIYTQDLLGLLALYQQQYPHPTTEILEASEAIELDFLKADFPKLMASMKIGSERIREIVQSLRIFSRLDEVGIKGVDIHTGIDSTLMILQNQLKAQPERPAIKVTKDYGELPLIECNAGQLNQVFMNLLSNAIDAIEEVRSNSAKHDSSTDGALNPPFIIHIRTEVMDGKWGVIHISDNGPGISEAVRPKLFDPFFTTKPVGQGTGLGLSISYQIVVEKHRGKMWCNSIPGAGAEFVIQLPIRQSACAVA
ncbi:MAG: PAS domain-containing protein [Cyanothece sp. SIO1E1]|nr:PAS domain-containing protein [Cyanothece sp. SIO1E1]